MTRDEFIEEFGSSSENYLKVQNSGKVELMAQYGMTFPKGENFNTSNEVRNQVADELRNLVAKC